MYNFKNRYTINWHSYTAQVNAGITRDLSPGDQVSGLAGMTSINVIQSLDLDWFNFSMRSDVALNLLIDVGPDSGAMVNWITFAYIPAVYRTVYDMAAPYGGAGSIGVLPLSCAFFRLRIQNPGAVNSTVFEFYARAWHT